jgi:hypothetical protein
LLRGMGAALLGEQEGSARRLRDVGCAPGRRLGGRGNHPGACARLPRPGAIPHPDQHLSRNHQRPRPAAADAEFGHFVATAEVDWSNPESVIDYLVDYWRILAGGERAFDDTRVRKLVRRDIERARDFAAVQNHDLMSHGKGSPTPVFDHCA